ncbi:putative replication endonuclease from prophage-like region [Frankliniella fusca]|uniref:Replication endonuclease from prophage-like region n=1 Tax=Frankliniella fusca TaxID=407009 RepID=A0AAE1HUD9_9NEOP|nr:putative replication endonuclease from prophage-like region [Frankliniella fusca]KAK3927613.1 putative replication endonuclease from prophage-like region [Frankliniella fusca]
MNHVKKMILVPHDSVAKLNDPTPPASETQLSALDHEMEHIMRQRYADDSLKWRLYNEALQRYLHFKNESRKPVQISARLKMWFVSSSLLLCQRHIKRLH